MFIVFELLYWIVVFVGDVCDVFGVECRVVVVCEFIKMYEEVLCGLFVEFVDEFGCCD